MFPVKKKDFEFYRDRGILYGRTPSTEIVERNVNFLIMSLFSPKLITEEDGESGSTYSVDVLLAQALGIFNEPVNWGDLGCVDVEPRQDGSYLVTIEEAGDCPNLCKYIQVYMASWGWNVEVETQW